MDNPPPEPNPDGSYTFSPDALAQLRSCLDALKQPDLPHATVLQYIAEAQAQLPTHITPSAELLATEVALLQRYAEELQKLTKSQESEMDSMMRQAAVGGDDAWITQLHENHDKERRDLEAQYQTDLTRFRKEDRDAQRLLQRMAEERPAQATRRPDGPSLSP